MLIRIKEIIKGRSGLIIPLLAVAVGVFLALISDASAPSKPDVEKNDNSIYSYTESLEGRLQTILSEIKGAGETYVMVTLESSFESVYASNARLEEGVSELSSSVKNTEKEIALAGSKSGGEEPVLLKSLCPKVKGVIVVCGGAESDSVVKSIKSAVSTLLGINETKVSVVAGRLGEG